MCMRECVHACVCPRARVSVCVCVCARALCHRQTGWTYGLRLRKLIDGCPSSFWPPSSTHHFAHVSRRRRSPVFNLSHTFSFSFCYFALLAGVVLGSLATLISQGKYVLFIWFTVSTFCFVCVMKAVLPKVYVYLPF